MKRKLIWQQVVAVVCLAACVRSDGQSEPSNPAEPPPATLTAQIAQLVSDPAVSRDHWGIMVTNLDGGVIFGLNQAELFEPASNAKLYTTTAAMALLGPEQRFTTRVEYGRASDKGKLVDGDVVIIGAGDANLNNRDFPYRSHPDPAATTVPVSTLRDLAGFADQIAAAGVKRIKGDIVGDDTVFPWEPYPEAWSIDDMVWGYGAPVSGLTIADNQIKVTVRPGKSAAKKPEVEWPQDVPAYYTIDTTGLVTGPARSGDHVQMDRAVGSKLLRIYGSIAADAQPDTEEIAIADPAEFAAIALKALLEERGVRVEGVARAKHRLPQQSQGFLLESREALANLPGGASTPGRTALPPVATPCNGVCPNVLTHTSPTVAEDIVLTNKISQNLHAELLLRHLGKAFGQPYAGGDVASTAEGARVVRQFLLNVGLDPHDFVFYDGSGLSSHDLVTPRATAKLLQFAATQPWFAEWKASLPVGGEDGSLGSRFPDPPLKDHVFAKTGTLGEARALSGYLECASGRTVIFSIMVDNHPPGDSSDRVTMDKIVAAIAAAE